MMIKINGEYLDFDGDIDIEKKIKLFEEIDTVDGDVSFSFDVDLNSHNISLLKPFPDLLSKTVYQTIDCEIENDSGININSGTLRIEKVVGRTAVCSFLGGNSNWFAMLTGNKRRPI
jgi:hypothetical protein